MNMILKNLCEPDITENNKWIFDNIIFSSLVSNKYIAISVPPKQMVFPDYTQNICGFGKWKTLDRWCCFIKYNKNNDICIYNIIEFFQLLLDGDPEIVETLFLEDKHILLKDKLWDSLKEERKLFLNVFLLKKYRATIFQYLYKLQNNVVLNVNDNLETSKMILKYCINSLQVCVNNNLNLDYSQTYVNSFLNENWSKKYYIDYCMNIIEKVDDVINNDSKSLNLNDKYNYIENILRQILFTYLISYYNTKQENENEVSKNITSSVECRRDS